MAIHELNKAEIESVSGGAVITIDTGALPGLPSLSGLLGTVNGLVGGLLTTVTGLLGTVTGLLGTVTGLIGLPAISLTAALGLTIG